ncbi:MAG: hypothetical protein ACTIJ6_06030 [Leucobacter sp.]
MNRSASKRSITRVVLVVVLVLALVVLAAVAAILIPILTHQSGGGSGQEVPTDYVSESSATGADGRNRVLTAHSSDGKQLDLGEMVPGEEIVVSGEGFDATIGIYVGFCAIPESPEMKPSPCLGGIPEGAETGGVAAQESLASAWITDNWAWKSFATQGYDDAESGSFEVRLTVPEPTVEGLDCTVSRCAIATRADHTAAKDRVQDMLLPIGYR